MFIGAPGNIQGNLDRYTVPKEVNDRHEVDPMKYAHGFVLLCFG